MYSPKPPSATLTPGGTGLAYGQTYEVRITTAATDFEGTHLSADKIWTFTTVGLPNAPIASAGPYQDVARSSVVTLDGSGSVTNVPKPGSQALSYAWTQTLGGSLSLTGVNPTFSAPAAVGTVQFKLVVTDSANTPSAASFVQINVIEQPGNALWVQPPPIGSDANTGSRLNPLATIQHAIDSAAPSFAGVYVGAGVYSETLTLKNKVSIYGGYDGNWVRDTSSTSTSITQVNGGSAAVIGQSVTGLTIDGLTVFSADGTNPGDSSYGFLFANSTVTVKHNHITAGSGKKGADGAPGATQSAAANGGAGTAGCDPVPNPLPSGSTCITPPGGPGGGSGTSAGGNGGVGIWVAKGGAGADGASGGGSGGAGGNQGQQGINNVNPGVKGTDGGDYLIPGGPGNDATGSSAGSNSANGYTPGDGFPGVSAGQPGKGGGGGGGGGGWCDLVCTVNSWSSGNGGGGGGSGGAGGDIGGSGKGGGGSFGIYIFQSTVTGGNTTDNDIHVGLAGNGGNKGFGSAGGAGGSGGPGNTAGIHIGNGGKGGHGSDGGKGGDGSAGPAGPAKEVYP
jgi:hypothetical protein